MTLESASLDIFFGGENPFCKSSPCLLSKNNTHSYEINQHDVYGGRKHSWFGLSNQYRDEFHPIRLVLSFRTQQISYSVESFFKDEDFVFINHVTNQLVVVIDRSYAKSVRNKHSTWLIWSFLSRWLFSSVTWEYFFPI